MFFVNFYRAMHHALGLCALRGYVSVKLSVCLPLTLMYPGHGHYKPYIGRNYSPRPTIFGYL